MTLGKLSNFSTTQFHHLYNGDNNRRHITKLLCGLNELIHAKQLEEFLSHSERTCMMTNVSYDDGDD